MAKYSTNNTLDGTQQNLSTSYKTLQSLTAQTTSLRRFKIYDLVVGTDGTPADNEVTFDISRQTAANTGGSTSTPNMLDPADAAAFTVVTSNPTGEGTITSKSSVLCIPLNQRATMRWIAREGSELVAPATNLAGFALRAKSAVYASTCIDTIWFEEQ